jgi:hypothetical protein
MVKELYMNRDEVERLLRLMDNFNTDWVKICNTDAETNIGAEDGVTVELHTQHGEFSGQFITTIKSESPF